MKYSTSKEINEVVKKYVNRNWMFKRGKKHGLLYPPNCGLFVVVPGSPSDNRAGCIFSQEIRRLERRVYFYYSQLLYRKTK